MLQVAATTSMEKSWFEYVGTVGTCLVSLFPLFPQRPAAHYLGCGGQLELQRGAPTWWKCTWLRNRLGIGFTETVRDKEHEDNLKRLIGQALPENVEGCWEFEANLRVG